MKILGVGSAILPDPNKQSQVDHWRVLRPLRELAKHVDWDIEHSPTFIPSFEKYASKEEFTSEEMEKAFETLGEYDVIFSSYHPDPTAWTLLQVLEKRKGTQFVMDVDDDMFGINPDNPFWLKMTDEKVYWMQRMIANNHWVTTPSPVLAQRFRDRRPGFGPETVEVIPNFIADVYEHPKFDNGKKLVIGYMGGASHYADLHESGVLQAVQKLMHEYKHIHFKCIGQIVDTYLPKARLHTEGGKRGTMFFEEVFPNMNIDIAVAPLLDNIFNQGKSNIKWQEMTRAHSAVVASNVGPYQELLDGHNALLVENNPEAWYTALKSLVDSIDLRHKLVDNATKDVTLNWKLENNWQHYKKLFERVVKEGNHADHRTELGLSVGKAK